MLTIPVLTDVLNAKEIMNLSTKSGKSLLVPQ
jgi:hypothetical protein